MPIEEIKSTLVQLDQLEGQIKSLKELEAQYAELKDNLYNAMVEYNVDNYTTPGGLKFTKVNATEDKTEVVIKFNEDKFKLEHPAMYVKYVESAEKVTKGRKGYLRMTMVGGEE